MNSHNKATGLEFSIVSILSARFIKLLKILADKANTGKGSEDAKPKNPVADVKPIR